MKTLKVKDLNEYGKLVDKLAEQIKASGKINCKNCNGTGRCDINEICDDCKGSGYILKYKAVYSPGNPMLAFLLSKKLGISISEKNYSHDEYGYKIGVKFSYITNGVLSIVDNSDALIVSDILNIGKTREQYKDFDFACLFIKKQIASSKIDNEEEVLFVKTYNSFYVELIGNDTKVVMPWEEK